MACDHNQQRVTVNPRSGQRKRKLGVTLGEVDLVVTGAGGQIGRFLRRIWMQNPPAGLRPLWVGRRQDLDLSWDILSESAPAWPKSAIVLHLAGVVRGDGAALATNAAMVGPVLQACRRNDASALLVASSAAVYAPGPMPMDEDVPPAPVNAYGCSKAQAERHFLTAHSGLPVHALRLGNVVGAESLLRPRPTNQIIRLDPVPGREGGPLRSWIGPVTLARVVDCLCRRLAAGDTLPPVLNVAADPPLAMADLLKASGRAWTYGPYNPAVVPVATLETARLRAICPLPATTAHALIAELVACGPETT